MYVFVCVDINQPEVGVDGFGRTICHNTMVTNVGALTPDGRLEGLVLLGMLFLILFETILFISRMVRIVIFSLF